MKERSAAKVAIGVGALLGFLVTGTIFSFFTQQLGALRSPYLEAYVWHGVWVVVFPIAFLSKYLVERSRKKEGLESPLILPWRRFLVWGSAGGALIVFDSVVSLSAFRVSWFLTSNRR